ncbi:PapB/FocB family fimbrial expression transcriptional regulator [Citrobacter freundii]|nr:hypothetical protein [Citrobacter freundii]
MRSVPGYIIDGKMDIRYFRLLSTVCTIRNVQRHQALANVMADGLTRREACECFGVSQSHFSIKYR